MSARNRDQDLEAAAGSRATAVERVRPIAERVARSRGLELFDVQFRRESVGWVLRVIIDRPAPADGHVSDGADERVGVEDCQRVSEDLSAILDVEDPIAHAYTLEVSSPGLDRPLRTANDFRRFRGRLAKIVVGEPVDGQKHFGGRLQGVEDEAVLVAGEKGRVHRIPLAAITRARLEVEF